MFVNKTMVYSFQILVLYYPRRLPSSTPSPTTRVLRSWNRPTILHNPHYTYKFFLRSNPMYPTTPIPFHKLIPIRPRRTLRQRALNTRVSYLISP